MTLVVFVKTAAGGSFGPYKIGDRADLTAQTITDLGDAVVTDSVVGDTANQPAGIE